MVKDVYAIYEKYITEDGYDFTSLGTRQPGKPNAVAANANHTSIKTGNYGGVGIGGAFQAGPNSYTPGGPVAQAEETPIVKKLKKDIEALAGLVNKGSYGEAIVFCNAIQKLIQAAHDSREKAKNKKK